MRPLHINFAARAKATSPLKWLLLVTGLIAFCVAMLEHTVAKDQLEAAQANLSRKATSPRQAASTPSQTSNSEGSKSLQRAVDQIGQPWGDWFGALEELSDSQVSLLGIEMKGNPAFVRLNAESRSMSQALAYLKTLRSSRIVGSAVLSSHEVVRVGEADVIRFTVDLSWNNAP